MTAKKKPKTGRPSTFDQKIVDQICARISMGESLRSICRDEDMPNLTTAHMWFMNDVNGVFGQYARSRETQAWLLFDEIIEISDDSSNDYIERETEKGTVVVLDQDAINRSRLRIDTRKWVLSKVLRKTFGDDKVPIIGGGNVSVKLVDMASLPDRIKIIEEES